MDLGAGMWLIWASQVALVVKNLPTKAGDLRDKGLIPGLARSPGGGHSNSLQYTCLENPMNRRARWATVHRATKSWTQLKWLTTRARMHVTQLQEGSDQGSLLGASGKGFIIDGKGTHRKRQWRSREPEAAWVTSLSTSEGPAGLWSPCESLSRSLDLMPTAEGNHCPYLCFALLTLQQGERIQGESLGTGPQLGSSWMNWLVIRSGESFSAGLGHRRIWVEEEKELLVLCTQGSQEPALQAISSTAPFWAIWPVYTDPIKLVTQGHVYFLNEKISGNVMKRFYFNKWSKDPISLCTIWAQFLTTQTWFSLQRGWAGISWMIYAHKTHPFLVGVSHSRWRPDYKHCYVIYCWPW